MAQEHINLGTPPAGVDGDTTRVALQKCEDNFNEIYPLAGAGMFKNKLINGNFDWWQRGTSFSGITYAADRWRPAAVGSGGAYTQQVFAANQTAVPNGPAFFFRTVTTSVAGAGNSVAVTQKIEDVRLLAGKMVTVSFWAKADAARPIGVGVTQNFGSGGSPSANVDMAGQKLTLSAAWQYFSVTFAVPAIGANVLGTATPGWTALNFWLDAGSNVATASGNIGQQSGTFDIAQVQLEVGSVPTPFEMRPFGIELALCQRYFQKSYDVGVAPGTAVTAGAGPSQARWTGATSGGSAIGVRFGVTMRTTPTWTGYDAAGAAAKCSYLLNAAWSNAGAISSVAMTTTGFTAIYIGLAATITAIDQQWTADAEL